MKNKMLLMLKLSLTSLILSSFSLVNAQCSDLFISEYVEGGGLNKALEIYNPTRNTIDLSTYSIKIYVNGSSTGSTPISLTGNLLADSVYVIANSGAVTALKNKADLLASGLSFSGDDAISLRNNGVDIDIFGEVGTDPGSSWSANGVNTKDKTLLRKFTIQMGVSVNPSSFDPSIEWNGMPKDDFTNIGIHTSACTPTCVNDTTHLAESICADESFSFNNEILTNAGTYYDTLTNVGGCDSLIVLTLTVNQLPTVVANTTTSLVCAGSNVTLTGSGAVTYVWDGNVDDGVAFSPTSTSDYIVLGEDANGCLNTDTITLTVLNVSAPTITIFTSDSTLCEGEGTSFTSGITNGGMSPSFQWKRNGNNVGTGLSTYSSQAPNTNDGDVITCEVTSSGQCGTTVVSNSITILVGTLDTVNLTQTICEGDSVVLGTQTLSQAGNYSEVLTSITGCDSLVNLELIVTAIQNSTFQDTICGGTPYQFGGQQIISSGSYADTLQAQTGCDSIVTLELFVKPMATSSLTEFICDGDTYTFDNMTLTQSGTYSDTLVAANGCDSISTLHLIVGVTDTIATSDIVCNGETVIFGTQSLTQSGTYTETFTSAGGCDSIVSLTLEVVMNSVSNVFDTICSNDSIEFGGVFLTQAGIYTNTILNNAGCDSVITYNLAIFDVYVDTIDQEICLGDSLVVGGVAYYQAGTYSDTLQTIHGCDSIVSINLSLNYPTDTLVNESICNGSSVIFGNDTITAVGTYTKVFQSVLGCDSTVTMVVEIGVATDTTVEESICQGDIYYFANQALIQTGTYNHTFTNVTGCDSIVHLILAVKVNPIVSITEAGGDLISTQGNAYQWFFEGDSITGANNQTYTPTDPGVYTVEMTAFNGCSGTNNYTMTNVSITEVSSLEMGIAPNPSKGIFKVTSSVNVSYVVYNLLGDIIMKGQSFNENHIINLSENENGIYLLKLTTENEEVVIKRLIKN